MLESSNISTMRSKVDTDRCLRRRCRRRGSPGLLPTIFLAHSTVMHGHLQQQQQPCFADAFAPSTSTRALPRRMIPSSRFAKARSAAQILIHSHADTHHAYSPRIFALSSTKIGGNTKVNSPNTALDLDHLSDWKYEILSVDPLIYTAFDVLSPSECEAFQNRANSATSHELTRSNPPEVSLDLGKLWPLPFLCIGAGLPPVIRLFESQQKSVTMEDIINAALPPILIAGIVASGLALGVTQLIRSQSNAKSRTSDALALNTETDYDLITHLVNRVSQVSGNHPWRQFEAPVLTRYQPGAIFATHNDASPTLGSEWSDLGGQRVVTAITYLNDCPLGGGTRFDRLSITVQPKQGMTLVFYPADGDTLVADDRTRHESLEAVEEKYIVQMFGRVGRVPPPLGLPDSFEKVW